MRSQIVINSTYCWITVRGKLHRNHSDDQKITIRLTFLQSEKRKHAQPLLLWDASFGFPALVFFLSVCQSFLSFCHPSICFALLAVLSSKEPVMVEPGERSNFASSALFLWISVVLYVVLSALQERKNSNSHTHTHTHTRFFDFYHLRSGSKIGQGPIAWGSTHDKRGNML